MTWRQATGPHSRASRPRPGRCRLVGTASDARDFTVERTAGSYHVRGRSRRLPLARWAAVGPITGVFLIRFTVGGQWQEPVNWLPVVFWPFVGALITVVGFLTPRRPVELEQTRDAITSVVGRRRHSYAWHSIEEITARRAVVRGRDMRF